MFLDHLQGYSKNREFIVTQCPLPNTTVDFWRMVWDQNSDLLVQLSTDTEVSWLLLSYVSKICVLKQITPQTSLLVTEDTGESAKCAHHSRQLYC